ncbi:MAG: TonB-dependent receptor [Myxococcota bacterium]
MVAARADRSTGATVAWGRRLARGASLWVWASAAFGLATPVAAQQSGAADPFAGVEEMVVTGTGNAELLNPSSTSAIAFDTKDLANIGVEDVGDLDAYVPNLEIASVNATNASFFVRGVGLQDFGANASSSVPIFQDGVPRNPSATQLTGLFDIGGLSVLKGPQGSGNFRNASAGAFIVKTQAPSDEFGGYARMTLARIASVDARDANRYQFETAVNSPIYEDIVTARISARYSHENPFWENRCANRTPIADRPVQGGPPSASVGICGEQVRNGEKSQVQPFLNRYIGEIDDYAIRGQLRIKPPELPMEWTVRVEFSNLNRDSTAGQALGTGGNRVGQGDILGYRDRDLTNRENFLRSDFRAKNPTLSTTEINRLAALRLAKEVYKTPGDRHPYAGDLDQPGKTLLETHSVSTTGVIDLDFAEATVNFGFIDYRKSESRDTDLTPNVRFSAAGDDQAWEYYGDFSLKGDAVGELPVSWDFGAYTMLEQVEAFNDQSLFGDTQQQNEFTQEIFSGGAYLNIDYEFLESFTLSAGARYNWERKDFEVKNTQITEPFPGFQVRSINQSDNQRTWDAFTGFVNLEYAFTEDVSTYLKYSRGFKAGHFNPSDATAAKIPGRGYADPEQIDAVEWGVNASFWADRVTSNGSFFYYNYRNYQVFRLTTNFQGVSRVVQNAAQARNYGAELEFIVRPLEGYVPEEIEGLTVTLRGGWLEAQFVEFTVVEQRFFAGGSLGVPIDYSGNSLLNAANLQASAIFNWPVVTRSFGTITPQYDFTWTDDTPYDPNNGRGEPDVVGNNRFQPYLLGNRAYILHNLRVSWTPPGDSGVTVAGWCRNLTDQRYKTFAVDLSTFSGQQLWYMADPRVCGADFRFTW